METKRSFYEQKVEPRENISLSGRDFQISEVLAYRDDEHGNAEFTYLAYNQGKAKTLKIISKIGADDERWYRFEQRVGKINSAIGTNFEVYRVDDPKEIAVSGQYIAGKNLEECIKTAGRKFTQPEVSEFLWQILQNYLSPLYDAGLVHKDIRPQNFIIDDEGQSHLIDCTSAIGDLKSSILDEKPAILKTMTMTIDVDPYYSKLNFEKTVEDNFHSLGRVVGYMLTGQKPEIITHNDLAKGQDLRMIADLPITDEFKDFLKRMMGYSIEKENDDKTFWQKYFPRFFSSTIVLNPYENCDEVCSGLQNISAVEPVRVEVKEKAEWDGNGISPEIARIMYRYPKQFFDVCVKNEEVGKCEWHRKPNFDYEVIQRISPYIRFKDYMRIFLNRIPKEEVFRLLLPDDPLIQNSDILEHLPDMVHVFPYRFSDNLPELAKGLIDEGDMKEISRFVNYHNNFLFVPDLEFLSLYIEEGDVLRKYVQYSGEKIDSYLFILNFQNNQQAVYQRQLLTQKGLNHLIQSTGENRVKSMIEQVNEVWDDLLQRRSGGLRTHMAKKLIKYHPEIFESNS